MAITVKTGNPRDLLSSIRQAVDDGSIETWSYDGDGDFTHTSKQWAARAWLRPRVRDNSLVFYIVPPRGQNITKAVYGIYHGRFIEMLLNHFDKQFAEASASALPVGGDRVKGTPVKT